MKLSIFDATDFLTDAETIEAYKRSLVKEGGVELVVEGLDDIARARKRLKKNVDQGK